MGGWEGGDGVPPRGGGRWRTEKERALRVHVAVAHGALATAGADEGHDASRTMPEIACGELRMPACMCDGRVQLRRGRRSDVAADCVAADVEGDRNRGGRVVQRGGCVLIADASGALHIRDSAISEGSSGSCCAVPM
eukprot:gene8327-biopygen12132